MNIARTVGKHKYTISYLEVEKFNFKKVEDPLT